MYLQVLTKCITVTDVRACPPKQWVQEGMCLCLWETWFWQMPCPFLWTEEDILQGQGEPVPINAQQGVPLSPTHKAHKGPASQHSTHSAFPASISCSREFQWRGQEQPWMKDLLSWWLLAPTCWGSRWGNFALTLSELENFCQRVKNDTEGHHFLTAELTADRLESLARSVLKLLNALQHLHCAHCRCSWGDEECFGNVRLEWWFFCKERKFLNNHTSNHFTVNATFLPCSLSQTLHCIQLAYCAFLHHSRRSSPTIYWLQTPTQPCLISYAVWVGLRRWCAKGNE